MTHSLANPMAIDTGKMVLTCNPLQPREELLDNRQMGATHGGWGQVIKKAVEIVVTYVVPVIQNIVAGVTIAEVTTDDKKPSDRPGCCSCSCKP